MDNKSNSPYQKAKDSPTKKKSAKKGTNGNEPTSKMNNPTNPSFLTTKKNGASNKETSTFSKNPGINGVIPPVDSNPSTTIQLKIRPEKKNFNAMLRSISSKPTTANTQVKSTINLASPGLETDEICKLKSIIANLFNKNKILEAKLKEEREIKLSQSEKDKKIRALSSYIEYLQRYTKNVNIETAQPLVSVNHDQKKNNYYKTLPPFSLGEKKNYNANQILHLNEESKNIYSEVTEITSEEYNNHSNKSEYSNENYKQKYSDLCIEYKKIYEAYSELHNEFNLGR